MALPYVIKGCTSLQCWLYPAVGKGHEIKNNHDPLAVSQKRCWEIANAGGNQPAQI